MGILTKTPLCLSVPSAEGYHQLGEKGCSNRWSLRKYKRMKVLEGVVEGYSISRIYYRIQKLQ
jgi:hypothetical protein